MKIGVNTCWNSLENYGQTLQGYALQQILKSLGHDAFIIRYGDIKSTYYLCFDNPSLKYKAIGIWKGLRHPLKYKKQKEIYKTNLLRNFSEFKKQNIQYSNERYSSYQELLNNPPKADCYITGSDQVWSYLPENILFKPGFLTFATPNTRKISYAASFGPNAYFKDNINELTQLLADFHAVSVREQSGVDLCKEANIDAQWVLDPTFLWTYDFYKKFIKPQPKHSNPYAFLYSINIKSAEDIRFTELQQQLATDQVELIITPAGGYYQTLEVYPSGTYDYASIEDWLTNIYYSKYVVTTSFHGVAFSLILHKNFVFIPLNDKHKKGNDRVTQLLTHLGIEQHILNDNYNSALNSPIDWNMVDEKLNSLREFSLSFLKQALS